MKILKEPKWSFFDQLKHNATTNESLTYLTKTQTPTLLLALRTSTMECNDACNTGDAMSPLHDHNDACNACYAMGPLNGQ